MTQVELERENERLRERNWHLTQALEASRETGEKRLRIIKVQAALLRAARSAMIRAGWSMTEPVKATIENRDAKRGDLVYLRFDRFTTRSDGVVIGSGIV